MAPELIEPVTPRLALRQWREDDKPPFAALNADPLVMEHFPAPLTREQSDAMVDRCAQRLEVDGFGLWAVEVRGSGELIGMAGLAMPEWEAEFTPCTEVGWRLARSGWGHGYATEAARAALATAFGPAGLDEVLSFTTVRNLRSQRVMQRLGMTRDLSADFEHPSVPDGPFRRHVLFRLSAPVWSLGAGR